MVSQIETAWARLSFIDIAGTHYLGYEDSRGRTITPATRQPAAAGWTYVPLRSVAADIPGFDVTGVFWPDAASGYLFELAGALPLLRTGTPHAGPVPVAILVDPPTGRPPLLMYEQAIHVLMETVGLAPPRYAVATDLRAIRAPEQFTLPFDVAYVGRGASGFRRFVAQLLSGLTPTERNHAISVSSPQAGGLARGAGEFDIVVTSSEGLASLRPAVWGPRLVIVRGLPQAATHEQLQSTLPLGTSLVGIPQGMGSVDEPMIEQIVRGLTHDWPLHEAVAAAGREIGLTIDQRERIRVLTSTPGLDALRMSSAFEAFERSHHDLVRLRGIERLELPSTMVSFDVAATDLSRITRAIEQGRQVDQDFRRESAGMSEMARAQAAQEAALADLDVVSALGTQLSGAPDLDQIAARQHRRATIWFGHDHTDWDPSRTPEPTRATILARRRRYVLNVGVGIDWPTDLVAEDTPALDPMLPPTDDRSHRLRVAVFSDRVQVIGARSRVLDLPEVGPAGPAQFVVEMPTRLRSAKLRIALYYRRHALQVFEIDLRLDAAERVVSYPAFQVTLAFSRVDQIREVARLPERTLSLTTNATSRGTHRFMFDEGEDISLSEKLTDKAQTDVRKALATAFQRFHARRGVPARVFETTIKALAQVGADLWDHLDTVAPDTLSDRFLELRTSSGGTIQVVRLHPEFAFPLAILYDWALPPSIDAIAKAPVCTGVDDGGTPCACDAKSAATVCVRGFWGIRHVIEEFLREQDAQDHVPAISSAPGAAPVLCTVGREGDDEWSRKMLSDLETSLGAGGCERLASDTSLYDRMWDETRRPAVLVVVGHLTTKAVGDGPPGARLYVGASERWIAPHALNEERRSRGRWSRPTRSIVLLLGCSSSQDALADVHNFVNRLAKIGAAAVIATEEKIDTSLAARVSSAVVADLAGTGPGEALRSWRAQLLTERNPLGFLFTCFGNSDTTVSGLLPGIPGGRPSPG